MKIVVACHGFKSPLKPGAFLCGECTLRPAVLGPSGFSGFLRMVVWCGVLPPDEPPCPE